MSDDIRLSTAFFRHPKTVLLRHRLGPDAVLSLQQLWCYCADYKPSGDLTGMSDDAIEAAAGWEKKPGKLIENLTKEDTRFIDRTDDGKTVVHDWLEHNPWASGSTSRSDASRFSRMAKTHPHIYNELKAKGVNAITAKEYHSLTNRQRIVNEPASPYPSPSPSPLPSPSPTDLVDSFEADKITSDTPLPPLLQAEWDRLLEVYPKPRGIVKGKDRAVRLFVKSAERTRILRNARHYSCSADVARGFVVALDRFVEEAFRDHDTPENAEPSGGPGPPVNNFAEQDRDRKIAEEEREKRKRGELPPLKRPKPFACKDL